MTVDDAKKDEKAMKKDDKMMRAALFLGVLVATVGLTTTSARGQALRLGAPAPEVAGERWINSEPLTTQSVRGRVVLVEFWTYG